MWIEAILTEDDLSDLARRMTPLTIRFGNDGDLSLHDVRDVSLVADRGLRIVCKAKLHWPILGIHFPIVLHSVDAILIPVVRRGVGDNGEGVAATRDMLVFRVELERADLAGIPTVIDNRITAKVNQELAKSGAELTWRFSETLSHVFALPDSLQPKTSLGLRTAWGEVKVTATTVVLAVSIHADVGREAPRPREGVRMAEAGV